jgi:glycosyltransferase involved in cell wall biosynthesis
MSLSVAIIAKNEEASISKCLDSVKDIVDEIVVVDTGSTDKTKEIALQYTSKVFDFPWINDFSAARNFAFDKTSSDFIFWVDCDDTISKKDQEKIKNLDLSDKEIVLFRYNYSRDEFGVVECVLERERIVKKSLGLRWQKAIHEYLPLNGKLSREEIYIDHHKQHGSSERNLEILEKIVKKDSDARNFFYLGKELADFGRTKEAIKNLEIFISKGGFWEDVFITYEIIARCNLQLKNEDEFFKNIQKSIQIEPRRAEPYYELGEYYCNKNDWGRAIHYFETCLNVKRSPELLSTYYPQYYTWKPALWLCICYNNIGDVQKAYEYNELFLKFRPNDSRGHNNKTVLFNSPKRKQLKDGKNKSLNLGCGNKRLSNYVNVDIVKNENVDEVFQLYDIPYQDNSISSINCEHALEHVSFERVRQAIKEWMRVLKPGGELLLYLPDLEECARKYLTADNSRTVNYIPEKEWFRATIFGIQRNENGSDTEHQFHLSGFSKEEIKQLLESEGFIIDYCENY